MPSDDEFVAQFTEQIKQLALYMQISERLRALLPHVKLMAEEVRGISQLDGDLSPELLTVIENLDSATDAIVRCFQFASTRLDVQMED